MTHSFPRALLPVLLASAAVTLPIVAQAQSFGGGTQNSGGQLLGGAYNQNGHDAGCTGMVYGGTGGGPGSSGTSGGAGAGSCAGPGGNGGANGATSPTLMGGVFTGAKGGDAPNGYGAGGGGGAGGYGYVLTSPGNSTDTPGQISTGGNGGAGGFGTAQSNGSRFAIDGFGGDGGGGLLLQQGGSFTNVAGASLIGGVGGTASITAGYNAVSKGGDGLTTSGYIGVYDPSNPGFPSALGSLLPATIVNGGTIVGGAGAMLQPVPGTSTASFSATYSRGGAGIGFLGGGSITNLAGGVIAGGVAATAFPGNAANSPGAAGDGGSGIFAPNGGQITNSGLIASAAGGSGGAVAGGGNSGYAIARVSFGTFPNYFNNLQTIPPSPLTVVNTSTGVIQSGDGGAGGSGRNAANGQSFAGPGGNSTNAIEFLQLSSFAGAQASSAQDSVVNDGVIAAGRAGRGGDAIDPGQFGGPSGFAGAAISTGSGSIINRGTVAGGAGGGEGASGSGVFGLSGNNGGNGIIAFPSATLMVSNSGTIAGGVGSTAGASGAGAAGGSGGSGGNGINVNASVGSAPTFALINTGTITGGQGGAASAGGGGAANGSTGAGGVGVLVNVDGTLSNGGMITGGLSGDSTVRSPAIALGAGTHTLTVQTGSIFNGAVLVDVAGTYTAYAVNPYVADPTLHATVASNTLNLDGAGTGTVSLPQFQNFGHLTQTGAGGGIWTLAGAGGFSVDASVASGTLVLDPASVVTTPVFNLLGGGTLSLANAASLGSGATVVAFNGGTLQVTGTGVTSLPNAITLGANGGGFDINAAANRFTVSQALGGTGGLTKLGTGTLILAGQNSYTGATAVNAGTLSVTGALASAVQVNGGGTLLVGGTVGGLTNAGGGTVLGTGTGRLAVNGQVSFAAGSTYAVGISPGGTSDRIIATGAATLGGGTVVVTAAPGSYAPNASFTILSAQGGVSGTFSATTTNLSSFLLRPSLSYTPTSVLLSFTRLQITGQTFNENAAAGVLNAAPLTDPLLLTVAAQSLPSNTTLDQLSGEIHATMRSALYDDAGRIREGVLTRLDTAATSEDVRTGIDLWGDVRGGRLTLDSDGNAARATTNSQAIVLGADIGMGSWRIGAAYANDWGNASVPDRASRGKWTGDSVAAYGGGALGPVAIRLGGTYGWYHLEVTRTPALSATVSDYDNSQYRAELGQLFGELALGKTLGRTRLEAFGRWTGLRLTTDAFAENGGLDALTGARRRTELGYSQVGARGSLPIGEHSSFTLSGAWEHAFGAITPAALLIAPSGTSFTVLGAPLARDAAKLSAAFTTQVGDRAMLRLGYTGEFASSVRDHQLNAGVTVRF